MTFAEQIKLLKATQGDSALLALATVDLQLAGRAPNEREKVRESLKVAAVPHWFDKRILAALLETGVPGAVALLVRLRELNVVEAFPAGGPGAVNVHQTVRTALRQRLAADNLDRLRRVSSLACQHFVLDEAVPTVIEALYHRFVSDPSSVADKCGAIFDKWNVAGRHEPLLALRTMLEELVNLEPWALPAGLVRGAALYYLAHIRNGYPRLGDDGELTKRHAEDAVAEFEAARVGGRAVRARVLLAEVLEREARSEEALKRAMTEYGAAVDLALGGRFGPSSQNDLRLVTRVCERIREFQQGRGNVEEAAKAARRSAETRKLLKPTPADLTPRNETLSFEFAAKVALEKNNHAVALQLFRKCVAIRQQMTAEQPGNSHQLEGLAIAHNRVGDALRKQGKVRDAVGAFRTGMAVIESLAEQDPLNTAWQKDLATACARTARALLQLPEGDQADARKLLERGFSIVQTLSQHRPLTLLEQEVFEDLQQLAAQADPAPPARDER